MSLAKSILLGIRRTWRRQRFSIALSAQIFSILLAALAIIAGRNYSAFAENREGLLGLPLLHADPDFHQEIDLEHLKQTSSGTPVRRLYIFVLDCSWSAGSAIVGPPDWYQGAISDLARDSFAFLSPRPVDGFAVSKVTLYTLLRELVEAQEDRGHGVPLDSFAIWDVCGKGRKVFPDGPDELHVIKENVKNAIKKLELDPPEALRNTTDLLGLFESLDGTYKIAKKSQEVANGSRTGPSFVVSVLSDFRDDPDGLGSMQQALEADDAQRQLFLAAREQDIVEATRSLMYPNVSFNFVVLARPDSDEPRIVSFMEQRAKWYLFNKFSLMSALEDIERRLLYPAERASSAVHLWYHNPLEVTSEARVTVHEPEEIAISLPAEEGVLDGASIVYGTVFGRNDPTVLGNLMPGDTTGTLQLLAGQSVFLRYSGEVPHARLLLKLFIRSERKSYLVPVRFVHRLTPEVAHDMLLVWGLLSLPVIFFLGLTLAGGWKGFRSPARRGR